MAEAATPTRSTVFGNGSAYNPAQGSSQGPMNGNTRSNDNSAAINGQNMQRSLSEQSGVAQPAQQLPELRLDELMTAHNGSASAALAKLIPTYNSLLSAYTRAEVERSRTFAENSKLWAWCSDLKRDRAFLAKENERQLRARQKLYERGQELQALCRANGLTIPAELSASEEDESSSLLATPRDSRRPSAIRSHSDHSGEVRDGEQAHQPRSRNPTSSRARQTSNQSTASSVSNASHSMQYATPPHQHLSHSQFSHRQLSQSMPQSSSQQSLNSSERSAGPSRIAESVMEASVERTPILRRKASSIDLGVHGSQGLLHHPSVATVAQPILTVGGPSNHRGLPLQNIEEANIQRANGQASRSDAPVNSTISSLMPQRQLATAEGLPAIVNSPLAPSFPGQQRPPQSSTPPLHSQSHQLGVTDSSGTSQPPHRPSHLPSSMSSEQIDAITTPTSERESFLPEFSTPASERSFIPSSPEVPRIKQLQADNREEGERSGTSTDNRPRASSAPLVPTGTPPAAEISPLWASQSPGHPSSLGQTSIRLTPAHLPNTQIKVVNSHITTNDRSREVISFTIQIALRVAEPRVEQSWSIEKKYSDVLALDNLVKTKNSRSQNRKIANLPDKSLFKDHAPSKVDMRKSMLQKYLQSLMAVPLQDKSDICFFLQSNVLIEKNAPVANPAHKEGALTKKGRLIGNWQTRYYVLQGPNLQYYETRGGTHLGQIDLIGAQIGRQQNQTSAAVTGDSYRHAFLIREARKDARSRDDVDHILCAGDDLERDEWVRVLAAWYTGEYVPPPDAAGTLPQSHQHQQSTQRQQSLPTHQETTGESPVRTTQPLPNIGQNSSQNHSTPRNTGRKQSTDNISQSFATQQQVQRPAHSHSHHQRTESAGRTSLANDELTAASSGHAHRLVTRRRNEAEVQPSASLPSNLDAIANGNTLLDAAARPPSEQGQQSDAANSKESLVTPGQRPQSPDKRMNAKISGPINGAPIGAAGFKSSRPPEERRARVKSSFWNFAVRTDRQPIAAQPRPVFGVPLAEAVSVARVREGFELPAVVFRCVEYLEAKSAASEEGLYRLSGSANVIRQLRERFNQEADINLLAQNEYYDVHAIAGLLKLFLRELPIHVLTKEMQPAFLQVCDLANRRDRVNELGTLVAQLPVANYTLLRFLSAHLMHVVSNEKLNRMNLRNIGIVFSPTIAIPATLFTLFLTEFNHVFRVLDDQPAPLFIEEDQAEITPEPPVTLRVEQDKADRRRSRNSVYYSNSGANALLEMHQAENQLKETDEESEEDANAADEEDSAEEQTDASMQPSPQQDVPEQTVDESQNPESNTTKLSATTSHNNLPVHDYQRNASTKGLKIETGGDSTTGETSPTAYLRTHSPRTGLPRSGLPISPRLANYT